ncbi:hypothetical protein [Stratiformator vulcanicus]|uniref:Uncharacterized protein n=1 Tax=Stratiformator vulcanicus TaxID=2527980 RepID=A0A517QXX4_9PLAN|nr:hypothetical protein [Stratiformator vulcanicus]QDT36502.1 hypothetical protein Pan189_08590 [Stratiformator vulcanicus]
MPFELFTILTNLLYNFGLIALPPIAISTVGFYISLRFRYAVPASARIAVIGFALSWFGQVAWTAITYVPGMRTVLFGELGGGDFANQKYFITFLLLQFCEWVGFGLVVFALRKAWLEIARANSTEPNLSLTD